MPRLKKRPRDEAHETGELSTQANTPLSKPRYALLIISPTTGEKLRPYRTLEEMKAAYKTEIDYWHGGNRLNLGRSQPPRIYGIDTRNGEKICG